VGGEVWQPDQGLGQQHAGEQLALPPVNCVPCPRDLPVI
jgi:hypothetical protein